MMRNTVWNTHKMPHNVWTTLFSVQLWLWAVPRKRELLCIEPNTGHSDLQTDTSLLNKARTCPSETEERPWWCGRFLLWFEDSPWLSCARHCTKRYLQTLAVIFSFLGYYQYTIILTRYGKLNLTHTSAYFPAHHIPCVIPDSSQSPWESFPRGPPDYSTKKVKTFPTPSYGTSV